MNNASVHFVADLASKDNHQFHVEVDGLCQHGQECDQHEVLDESRDDHTQLHHFTDITCNYENNFCRCFDQML